MKETTIRILNGIVAKFWQIYPAVMDILGQFVKSASDMGDSTEAHKDQTIAVSKLKEELKGGWPWKEVKRMIEPLKVCTTSII